MKISCLVVDDDPRKASTLRQIVVGEIGIESSTITTVGSANAAVEELRAHEYDLLIIDLNIPIRDDGVPMEDGGTKLLKQVARASNGICRPIVVIGVTSFEGLADDATDLFRQHGWTLLRYSDSSSAWEESLTQLCSHLFAVKQRLSRSQLIDIDVMVLTALADVELEAVLRLPWGFVEETVPNDTLHIHRGIIRGSGREMSAVACACPEMGNPSSAFTVVRLLKAFRPRMLFLGGIAGGIDAAIGDIAVAECALHYESGKWKEGASGEAVFLPHPRYRSGSDYLLEMVRSFKNNKKVEVMGLPAKWHVAPPKSPEVRIGPFASGAAVIENGEIVDELLRFRDRKLVAIEMESYGFYLAASHVASERTKFLAIKGICDNAVPPKHDGYQAYAAFLSATFIERLVLFESGRSGGIFDCS